MSDTFKFLGKQSGSSGTGSGSAAQDFLAKQMAKNKFLDTAQPIENVGKHTTTDPYAYGEGTVPGGEGYKDQQVVLNQKEIDAWHAANPGGAKEGKEAVGDGSLTKQYGKLADLGFDEERIEEIRAHAQGASGAGAFGYSADTEHHFRETEDKTSAGSIEADMRKIGKHMGYEHWGTANPERIKKYILEQEAQEAGEGPPKPKMGIKPIEHSQEIKQAKERVKTYEQGIESGQTSNEIFGNATFMDKYQQDFSKGAEGIGTSAASSGQESATSATQSFLDNKVSQVKKTLSPA